MLCNFDTLDIEFSITNSDQIIIFQVRPMTSISNGLDKKFIKTFYKQLQEKAETLDNKLKIKFINYPIPKGIIEEYNKVFK